jgi:hypothetical protein
MYRSTAGRRVALAGGSHCSALLYRGASAVMPSSVGSVAVAAGRSPSTAMQPATQMRFASMFETPGRRNEEAFLYQYDPLSVLGLPPNTNDIAVVKDAFERMKAEYGPTSKKASKTKMERIQQAYDILMDYQSVYYTKAAMDDQNRKQMMIQVMPQGTSAWTQFRAVAMTCLVAFGCFTFIYIMLWPIIKMARAASRGIK